jgi:hypothetical protein
MSDKPLENQWYVRTQNGASGPYNTKQIRDFAANGKLPRTAHLSKNQDGPWTVAENAKGLFPEMPPEQMTAGDFVPDVVKNSASAFTSAVSGISKSLVSQVKKIETGLAARAEAAASSINTLCADGQDPAFTSKIADRVGEICIRDEVILYIAVQSKPIANFTPDSVALTNRRFIIFRPKLLGRMSFVDCLWRDTKDVHVEENVFGATLSFSGINGHVETLDYIPKAQARMIYRHSQEQEEAAFHTRRNMHIEELQAGADRTVINQAIGTQATPPQTLNLAPVVDPIAKLTQLKQLLDAGIIDQSEFDAKKSELMKLI